MLFQKLRRFEVLAVVEILKIQIKVIKCIKIRSVSLPLVFDMTWRSSGVCLNKHFGFRSRIDNISGIRQSSFPQHFFRTENNFAIDHWTLHCGLSYPCQWPRLYALLYALVKMACGVTNIIPSHELHLKLSTTLRHWLFRDEWNKGYNSDTC